MTAKASPAGWVVQVTVPAPPTLPSAEGTRWIGPDLLGAPSFHYYNVAIADPNKAVEATRKYLAKAKADADEIKAATVRELSSAEVASLSLKAGEVKPA
jgi:fructose-specific component phosphotransferase system IIB-like protein